MLIYLMIIQSLLCLLKMISHWYQSNPSFFGQFNTYVPYIKGNCQYVFARLSKSKLYIIPNCNNLFCCIVIIFIFECENFDIGFIENVCQHKWQIRYHIEMHKYNQYLIWKHASVMLHHVIPHINWWIVLEIIAVRSFGTPYHERWCHRIGYFDIVCIANPFNSNGKNARNIHNLNIWDYFGSFLLLFSSLLHFQRARWL